ncbi:MAG: sel1 repeat family protein [Lewinellaceae bacterium]|nr:sel1 repeat family protein [Lewinellaceae bacterium]
MKDVKVDLKQLISKNKTEIAIQKLNKLPIKDKDLFNDIVRISARYNSYLTDLTRGVLDKQTANTENANIIHLLLTMIDSLPDNLTELIKDQVEIALKRYFEIRDETQNSDEYIEIFETLNAYKDNDFFTANQQEILAYLYREGMGTKKNIEMAFELYEKSAKRNWGWGQFGLAEMYFDNGDYKSCMYWCRKALENDVGWAFQKIGDMYRDGKGVEVNSNKAMEYYLKSAYRGVDWGYACLGDLFYTGTQTIERDKYLAKIMYEKAPKNKHAKERLANFVD